MKICAYCDKEIKGRRFTAKYCSGSCKQKAKYRRVSASSRECLQCGAPAGGVGKRQNKYCSQSCFREHKGEPFRSSSASTKVCRLCGEEKTLESFNKSSPTKEGGVSSYCRSCDNRKSRDWYSVPNNKNKVLSSPNRSKNKKKLYQLRKLRIDSIKIERGCVDCGWSHPDHPEALDFDHVRGIKEFSISKAGFYSWDRVEAEIAKCEVRCSRCHRIKTKHGAPNK